MSRKTLKERIARRHKGLCRLMFISLILCIIAVYLWSFDESQSDLLVDSTGEPSSQTSSDSNNTAVDIALEFIIMVVSALVSTTLAIYMTKEDIMENDYSEKKDEFGIITFESGYSTIFQNKDCEEHLGSKSWEQFFENATDKKICIVGFHINDFFENNQNRKYLLQLCLKGYKLDIILANPYSEEVLKQSHSENKPSSEYIRNKILNTYKLFVDDISKVNGIYPSQFTSSGIEYKPSDIIEANFNIHFSDTIPKALIFQSGSYMIITPYVHQSPSLAPTLVVENSRSTSFFENYERYIENLKENSYSYADLPKHIPAANFFTQPYRNLSTEFYEDIASCSSLKIMGLGQKHMFTQLESYIVEMLRLGGSIEAVVAQPDGSSTEMCVKRSILHNEVNEAVLEHKLAINRLVKLKDSAPDKEKIKVCVWDCFFPYTMYALNSESMDRVKIYIWITNLFESAENRLGFVIDGRNDTELVVSFLHQFNEVLSHADEITTPYSVPKL